jgi:hypothetical protein
MLFSSGGDFEKKPSKRWIENTLAYRKGEVLKKQTFIETDSKRLKRPKTLTIPMVVASLQ